jgi:type VI secretion system protein ImpA
MESPPTQKKIEAAVMTSDSKEFTNLVQAVEDCLKYIAAIENGFSDRLGAATGPNLELLEKELKGIARFHKAWAAMRKDIDGKSQPTESPDVESISESTSIISSHRAPVGNGPFVITRREDVIEGLDKIIAWLERNEPSSPLPMLLKRAKRLSTMSFMDILRDISPDGVTQAEVLVGPEPDPVEATPLVSSSNARGSGNTSKPVDPNDGY